jgi:enoyl-CoA hydratase
MPKYDGFETIEVGREERLLTIALNRPDSLNSVNRALHIELEDVFERVAQDTEVSTILLTGAGRSFCAGADIKELEAPDAAGQSQVERVTEMVESARRLVWNMLDVEQPIVAAVQGYAMGLGATLALFCDIVLAADDAVFADTHVNIGLVAGDGGTVIWPLLTSFAAAKYYLLTGDRISGTEAERIGLIHRAVPAEQLLDEARALAARLAARAPLALRGTKRAINLQLRERTQLLLDPAMIAEGMTFLSEDHQEASTAFVEKRPPVFRGR